MYKYRCVVSDSADENSFYEIIDKIKNLYPDYIENEAERSGDSPAEQLIKIPLANEKYANVCVKIDRSKKESGQVVVMTDTYLDGLFSEIYFDSPPTKGIVHRTGKPEIKFTWWHVLPSLGAVVINWLILWNLPGHEIPIIGVLLIVHILSSMIFKKKTGLSIFVIWFLQIGGFFSFAVIPAAITFLDGWDALFGFVYFVYAIPVTVISCIITSIILWIRNKMKGKYYAGK